MAGQYSYTLGKCNVNKYNSFALLNHPKFVLSFFDAIVVCLGVRT